MKRFYLGALGCLILAGLVAPAAAHDWADTASIALGDEDGLVTHEDEDPWKGLFTLTVTNSGTEAWGDFHFTICDPNNSVVFVGAPEGTDPSMSQVGTAGIADGGKTVNFEFYGDPVENGEVATFTVYTDNTVDQLTSFCLSFCPTPVPEPATMALVGLGGLVLVIRRRRK